MNKKTYIAKLNPLSSTNNNAPMFSIRILVKPQFCAQRNCITSLPIYETIKFSFNKTGRSQPKTTVVLKS